MATDPLLLLFVRNCPQRRAEGHAFAKDLGVDEALDYHDADIRALFLDNPFDVVIDMIGGAPPTSPPPSDSHQAT